MDALYIWTQSRPARCGGGTSRVRFIRMVSRERAERRHGPTIRIVGRSALSPITYQDPLTLRSALNLARFHDRRSPCTCERPASALGVHSGAVLSAKTAQVRESALSVAAYFARRFGHVRERLPVRRSLCPVRTRHGACGAGGECSGVPLDTARAVPGGVLDGVPGGVPSECSGMLAAGASSYLVW